MARIEVPMPQMGESIAEGTVSKWLKQVGDTVERDEPILEISTDKVDAEIPSPAEGTLVEIAVQEGETVEVGTIVAFIDPEGGAPSAGASQDVAPAAEAPAEPAAPASAPDESPAVPAPTAGEAQPAVCHSGRIREDQGRQRGQQVGGIFSDLMKSEPGDQTSRIFSTGARTG